MNFFKKLKLNFNTVMKTGSIAQVASLFCACFLLIVAIGAYVVAFGLTLFGGHFLWMMLTTFVVFRFGLAAFKGI